MVSKNDQPLPDIAWQLDQIGETTTAADLVRRKGQSRKLKVLSEKTLVGWIEGMLGQYIAGKEDSFSDREKEALLEKMQADLAAKIEGQGRLEKDRAQAQARLDEVMATLDNQKLSKGELDQAIKALKAQLEQKESHERELQQSNDEMQDELERHRALVAATIKEKDKLHIELQSVKERDATFRNHAVKSADLCGGILAIDRDYYGERHQNEHPVPPEATQEAAFFHDFDVAAAVIETLSKDLERLRQILHDQETGKQTKRDAAADNLLESDLQLLEQLKSGSLAATDVAEPVAALVTAIEGARAEAEALEDTASDQLGIAGTKKTAFSSMPEETGKPAEVLAGATRVVRELAAALARERQRLGAVKSMADEADEVRNERESELDRVREANSNLMQAIAVQAKAQGIALPAVVTKDDADVAERETAAVEVVRKLAGKDVKAEAEAARLKTELDQARGEGAGLRRQIDDLQAQLKKKRDSEGRLAASLKDLGRVVFAEPKPASAPTVQPPTASISAGSTRVDELDKAMATSASDQGDVLNAAYAVVDALKRDVAKRDEKNKGLVGDLESQRRSNDDLRKRLAELEGAHDVLKDRAAVLAKTEKAIAERVIEAAHTDPELADAAADLAVALEGKDAAAAQERSERAAATIELLAHRKQALAKQVDALSRELATVRADGDNRLKTADHDLAQARSHLTDLDKQVGVAREQRRVLEERVGELETERDEAMASGKEVIQQLNQSRERSVNELTDLRTREAAAQSRLTDLTRRVQDAEAANRALVEALSELQRVGGASPERAALDEAMTELPGDDDVPLKPEAAQKVAEAGKRLIADLAERSSRLAGATERISRTDARINELDRLLSDERAALAGIRDHVREVEHERDEMAASGKEVIAKLTQARDARIAELAETRAHAEQLQRTLASVQTRTSAAESANRALAESLSRIAAAESGARDVEDRRVELETCLSELPEDGEADVVVAPDLPVRLAEAGQRVVEAIVMRARSYKEVAAKAQAQAQEVQAKAERLDKDLATVRGEAAAAKTQ
ncbi:MAG: hypothetical protein H0X45_07425, partial [Planctomycetes bacterium]|nr:hypothetical protein [Planctomycetota bacterium]